MKTRGIYKISKRDGEATECYIGSSIDIKYRWQRHKSQLRGQYHENLYLQRSWDKYGEGNFIFEIIEECPKASKEELLAREQFFIDTIKPQYNLVKIAGAPPVDPVRSQKTMLSLWDTGVFDLHKKPVERIDPLTGECIEYSSQSEAAKINNCATTPISKCCTGISKTYLGFYWQHMDGSSPAFLSKRKVKEVVKYDLETGETLHIYPSAQIAAEKEGLQTSGISVCCHGKRGSHGNFGWRFATSPINWKYKKTGKEVVSYDLKTGKDYQKYKNINATKADGFLPSKVAACCREERKSHKGLGWRFLNKSPRLHSKIRQVKAVESFDLNTGKTIATYDNAHLAEKDGFNCNLIRLCLYGKRRSHKKLGWRYVGENQQFNYTKSTPKIQSLKEGKVIKEYEYAAKVQDDGYSPSKVSECCRGKRKTHKGLEWQYVDENIKTEK